MQLAGDEEREVFPVTMRASCHLRTWQQGSQNVLEEREETKRPFCLNFALQLCDFVSIAVAGEKDE